MIKCVICEKDDVRFSWTDTHGIAQCTQCGAPYRIYHYDAEHKRIEKPPVCIISEEWIEKCRQYWREEKRFIPSDCSFPGGQELANDEDIECWNNWNKKHDK